MALLDKALARSPAHLAPQIMARPGPSGPVALPDPVTPKGDWRPAARPARLRRRHLGVMLSFLAVVLLPALVTGWYLWVRAADQYASTLAFSVRKEQAGSAADLLGGFASLSGSSSADTDILYDYMHSQQLVADIDAGLDLRAIWSKPQGDPVFAYHPPGSIESLMDHWARKVRVSYDSTTRLIEIRVLAFDPSDARAIASRLFEKSTEMINRLNDTARADTLRFAEGEMARAETRLKAAHAAVTDFRNRHQSVDPAADLQGQTGLLANLQAQLADALIDSDLLRASTRNANARGEQADARIRVIENRIKAEREKLGLGAEGSTSEVFATLVGDYERLMVDRNFAETAYRAAQLAHEAALADARRQSLYLAAHIAPTLAETAEYPQRQTILAVMTLFLVLLWSIAVMVWYSLRDRR